MSWARHHLPEKQERIVKKQYDEGKVVLLLNIIMLKLYGVGRKYVYNK